MTISVLSSEDFADRIPRGVIIRIGFVTTHLQTSIPSVIDGFSQLYDGYPVGHEGQFVDFYIRLARPSSLRRWYKPQVFFFQDDRCPFKPLPLSQAFPMFEWGLNWCIANYCHQNLILHAAVVERDGKAIIIPGESGSGKSTLCAALVSSGWRLLSDEMAIIRPDGQILPIPRPVSLKNESIPVMREFASDQMIGNEYNDTRKGIVAHMKAPVDSVVRAAETALPAWVIAPIFNSQLGTQADLRQESKARMLMFLADNAFNYNIMGSEGFRILGDMMDNVDCYKLTYNDLGATVEKIHKMVSSGGI